MHGRLDGLVQSVAVRFGMVAIMTRSGTGLGNRLRCENCDLSFC